jgi:DNA-binding NarL/FixJ family response regulator
MEWRLLAGWERRATFDELQAIIDEGLTYYDRLDSVGRADIRMRQSHQLYGMGLLERSLAESEEAARLTNGPETGGFIWPVVENDRSEVEIHLGRWDDALVRTQRQFADRDHIEAHNNAVALAARVHVARGEHDTALELRSLLMPVVMSAHDSTTGYETRHFPTLIEAATLADAQPERARECLRSFLEDPDNAIHVHTPDFLVVAARLSCLGRSAEPDYVELVSAAAQALFFDDPIDAAYARQIEAYLAKSAGHDSAEAWAEATATWEGLPSRWYAAQARLALAECLVRDGDRDGAADALAPALAFVEELRARPLADEIRSFAARARLRIPGTEAPERTATGGLTARELEVLQLLVQGMTNDQIGSALFMSPRTASVHVSRILAKLHAANRTEVAAIAHRSGLLD